MQRRLLAHIVLLAGCAVPAAPQGATNRGGVSVLAAASWSGLVDQNASALRYGGPGIGGSSAWRGIYDNYRVEVGLSASMSWLRSRITAANLNRESALNAELRLAVLRQIAPPSGSGVSFFAGGQVLLSTLGRKHSFPYGYTENFADIFGALSAAGMWEFRRERGAVLSGTVALPLAAVAGRTPYYGLKAAPEFHFSGPLSLTAITHTLRMETRLTPGATLLLDYRTTLLRDDRPRTLRRIEHGFGTGLEFRRRAR